MTQPKRSLIATMKGKKDGGGFDPQVFAKELSKSYRRKSSSKKKKASFSPSTIVYGHGMCARYWGMAFRGATFEETVDAASAAAMENGTAAHDRIQRVAKDTGRVVEIEREVKNEDPPIRGFIDLVLDENGTEVLGEIKTIRSDMFQGVTDAHDPKTYHLVQLLIYMYVTKTKDGFILYENKDNHEICIMPVIMNERTTKLVEKVIEWMREVYKAYTDDQLPAPGFKQESFTCKNCPVRGDCWGDSRADVAIANLEIK